MATRCANLHVLMDSSSWSPAALMVATMVVRQLPPRLSLSAMVIMLLRYGMCGLRGVGGVCNEGCGVLQFRA